MLGRFTQVEDGLRRSELRRHSEAREAIAWAKSSKIRWAVQIMRFAEGSRVTSREYQGRDSERTVALKLTAEPPRSAIRQRAAS